MDDGAKGFANILKFYPDNPPVVDVRIFYFRPLRMLISMRSRQIAGQLNTNEAAAFA